MRLKLVRIRGYKRFARQSKLDTRGPLIAIVGPNEAGKTSLLEAMEHISSGNAFEAREFTRDTSIDDDDWVVAADFSLEADDRELLGDFVAPDLDLTYRRWVYPQGNFKYDTDPWMSRDLTRRDHAAETLRQAVDDGWLESLDAPDDEDAEPEPGTRLHERALTLAEGLASRDDWLSESVRAELVALRTAVEGHDAPSGSKRKHSALLRTLTEASEYESEPPLHQRVHEILAPRVPEFLLFGEKHRALETEYAWTDYPDPPEGLGNLFALAEIDYQQFRGHCQANDRPTMEMLQEAANRQLDEAFRVWHQDDLHVSVSADSASLHLHVRDRATAHRTRLDERSAGLRSFVALVAFTARYAGAVRPVLLIDEAETHLHYGGQADLVNVFQRQRAAETVIYTTHSIGCLPDDLGATIRVITPIEGELYRSTIYNSYWAAQRRPGLTPMVLAMGANALAFLPSRFAVIGEGASDAILLPSLVREALSPDERAKPLGYQVAPGVSEVAPEDAEELEMEAGGIAYLVDSDEGGRKHERKLSERARREGRVVRLGQASGQAQCTEDLVIADVLANAVNTVLGRRNEWCGDEITVEELPANRRATYLHNWCRERGFDLDRVKAPIAQEALDIARNRGALLERDRVEQVRELHGQLLKATETADSPRQAK